MARVASGTRVGGGEWGAGVLSPSGFFSQWGQKEKNEEHQPPHGDRSSSLGGGQKQKKDIKLQDKPHTMPGGRPPYERLWALPHAPPRSNLELEPHRRRAVEVPV